MLANDNNIEQGRSTAPPCDPHGRAALLLVESLLHVLKERSILTTAESLDVLSTAMEVQEEYVDESEGDGLEMRQAHALLSMIARSLKEAP